MFDSSDLQKVTSQMHRLEKLEKVKKRHQGMEQRSSGRNFSEQSGRKKRGTEKNSETEIVTIADGKKKEKKGSIRKKTTKKKNNSKNNVFPMKNEHGEFIDITI